MKRRFLRATEVEAMFNEVRKTDVDFANGEKSVVKTIIESAKRNGRIGDKVLLVLPPHYIHIPSWQRKADVARASEIGAKYNKYKWEVPKVVYSKGKLICVDGMHRIFGVLLQNIEKAKKGEKLVDIVIEVMEITEEEAIELFLGQTKDRGNMTPSDYYRASIKANKKEYVTFRDICHKYNVQVINDDALENPVGTFTSITEGTKTDPKTLDKVLNLINKLAWNGKETSALTPSSAAYGTKVIRSIKKLYAYYSDDEAMMEKILLRKCKGTEWFVKNLADMPQYRVFDLLNKEINDSLENRKNLSVAKIS